ncbi:MAG: protoheme IX farnesyltransferase [Rhizobiales bacterium]|nr:protoheme IX farnesyltransferase [Hyphomicrobiales bacterium]
MSDTSVDISGETTAASGFGEVADYFALLKPRVMSLVVFTALVGLVVAPGSMHPIMAFTSLLCIAIGAGASGALNMWYESDIDAKMSRTAGRPIPSGRISRQEALAFAMPLAIGSVLVLGTLVNWVAAALLAFTILFYVLVYTVWLKRITPQNIVIGGAAGALPPVVGWAAATGTVSLESLVLFAIIFIWTPPHFWALALYRSGDYARAGIPMMPVVAGEKSTKKQMLIYAALLAPIGVLPWMMGFAGIIYGVLSGILGLVFLGFAWRVFVSDTGKSTTVAARRLFTCSLFYLFLIFAILLGEQVFGLETMTVGF